MMTKQKPLTIDGAHGEGGGQILRTAVSLAAILKRPIRIESIRAKRRNPGLAAQHLTSVRAAATVCGAELEGDALGSTILNFTPEKGVRAGNYDFDVAEAREGGSAGTAPLVLQTILLPLAFAQGTSHISISGGTHMLWAPTFDYVAEIWTPALGMLGVCAELDLHACGWYPIGRGEISATVHGAGKNFTLAPLSVLERGSLLSVEGRVVASNLPAHVAVRMANRASYQLKELDTTISIAQMSLPAASAGAAIFLKAVYANCSTGFCAVGERGKPAEDVADEAARQLLAHHSSGAALDLHLGDQILAPLAFAEGPSEFTVESVSRHLQTNKWVIEQFDLAHIPIEERPGRTGLIRVDPRAPHSSL